MKKEDTSKQWFCEQVLSCEDNMYRIAMSILQNTQDAEDAIQEALYSAYEKLNTLKSPDRFRPWLLKILTNTAYDMLRQRRTFLPIDDVELAARQKDVSLCLTLNDAVSKLPVNYRQVVMLFYYEDMTVGQIAEIIGCSENVVKTRFCRARHQLRDLLGE